jgi:hypothetical protein
MKNRSIVAIAMILICAGSTFAQGLLQRTLPPAVERTSPPPVDEVVMQPSLSERIGISSFLPERETGSAERGWVSAEYLLAWMRGSSLPPLVTTGNAGTSRLNAGVFGLNSTRTLFGDSQANSDARSGFRFNTGYWFNPEQSLGIEGGFMILEGKGSHFSATSDGTTILARPFIDANTGSPSSQLIAFPGLSKGSIDASVVSSNFYEFHFDLSEKALDEGWFRLYSLIGYRYYRYDETIRVRQTINPTGATFIPGTAIVTNDNFHATNEFQGLDMGFRSQFVWDKFTFDLLTKLAVGRVTRANNINGDQTVTVPGATPIVQNAGFLAGGTNSGLSGTGDWKVMPEMGVALSWQVRPNVTLRLGYSFILLNGVNRAADQIDTTINPHFLPGSNTALGGPLRPANGNIRSDIWMQSANFGVLFTY